LSHTPPISGTYMKYFLILLALGMVVSPLLALQPSARDRQLRRLRERASFRGLDVRYVDGARPGNSREGIIYSLAVAPEPNLARMLDIPLIIERREAVDTGESVWRPRMDVLRIALVEELIEVLNSLPEDVVEVNLTRRRLGVLWKERGNEQDVDRIADVLLALFEKLKRACDRINGDNEIMPTP